MGYIDIKNNEMVQVERDRYIDALEKAEKANIKLNESSLQFYNRIESFNKDVIKAVIQQLEISIESEPNEHNKELQADLLEFFKDIMDTYIEKHKCTVLFNDVVGGALVLAKIPGLEFDTFVNWVNRIQFITIDYSRTRNIEFKILDFKTFNLLLDLAVGDPIARLNFTKGWDIKIPKQVENNLTYQNYLRFGYKPIHVNAFGAKPTDENGTALPEEQNPRQAVMMAKFTDSYDKKKQLTDLSVVQVVDLWLDCEQDILLASSVNIYSRFVARALLSYIETVRGDFIAKDVYQQIKKEIINKLKGAN